MALPAVSWPEAVPHWLVLACGRVCVCVCGCVGVVRYAHGAGEIMSNPLVCRYVLLNFDIWVHTSDECLATLLRSLHQSIEFVRPAHARINRDVLRSVGVVRQLLTLLMTVNLTGEVMAEMSDLLQALLLDTEPNFDDLQAITTFLATTLSRSFVARRRGGVRVSASMVTATPATISGADPAPASGAASVVSGVGASGGVTASSDRAASLAEWRGVADMHNTLLGMLTRVVAAFTAYEDSRRKRFLSAFMRAAPFKWLWLFMRRGRLASVASLRLVAQLLPHFPVRFKKVGGYRQLGAWLPTYQWQSEDGTSGGSTSPAGTIMYVAWPPCLAG